MTGPEERLEARAWVAEALHGAVRDCELCGGPLVDGERGLCRGCSDPDALDSAVEADLEPASDGTPPKNQFDTPLEIR